MFVGRAGRYSAERQCAIFNSTFAGKTAGGANERGYVKIGVEGVSYYAHVLAWVLVKGTWPDRNIDHANGLTGDNRFGNLRLAKKTDNLRNSKKPVTNKSGFKGVCRPKDRTKWIAQIRIDGRNTYLGSFNTPEEAHEVYRQAALQHFGAFARFV
ncbi:MAG TPA: HNH endonuclease [Rhizomicrobium sp.]|nr:HNH endonuclease [Rhizomicrobium sp.]